MNFTLADYCYLVKAKMNIIGNPCGILDWT